jgi:hypothetical protein
MKTKQRSTVLKEDSGGNETPTISKTGWQCRAKEKNDCISREANLWLVNMYLKA